MDKHERSRHRKLRRPERQERAGGDVGLGPAAPGNSDQAQHRQDASDVDKAGCWIAGIGLAVVIGLAILLWVLLYRWWHGTGLPSLEFIGPEGEVESLSFWLTGGAAVILLAVLAVLTFALIELCFWLFDLVKGPWTHRRRADDG